MTLLDAVDVIAIPTTLRFLSLARWDSKSNASVRRFSSSTGCQTRLLPVAPSPVVMLILRGEEGSAFRRSLSDAEVMRTSPRLFRSPVPVSLQCHSLFTSRICFEDCTKPLVVQTPSSTEQLYSLYKKTKQTIAHFI